MTGALLATIAVHPYVGWVGSWFYPFWTDGAASPVPPGMARDDRVAEMLMQIGRAILFWTAANYLFDRYLGLPRFRYEAGRIDEVAGPDTGSAHTPVRFLERLRRFRSPGEIWIVKAEEQYIRVIGAAGEELTLYRFNRAVIDLVAEDGFRVHRSYWIRRSAVVRLIRDGNQLTLEMQGGWQILVSKRYHALVQQML